MTFRLLRLGIFLLASFTPTASNSVQPDPLASLLECRASLNPHTQHLRIPDIAQNISQTPGVHHFNPTIIALPFWAESQYLLVSRVVTEGLHQESVLCEANICVKKGDANRREGEKDCPADLDLESTGGLYCATAPVVVNIPPTPAEQCDGRWTTFPDIPGFHDPRIFWSGKGEPLIIVNSASQYACVGLWITDLRTVYGRLKELIESQPDRSSPGPPIAYSQLTELTRNPASTRSAVEKNWFLFFPTPSTAYIHYDLSPPPLLIPSDETTSQETIQDHTLHIRREASAFEELLPSGMDTHSDTQTAHPSSSQYYGRTFAKLLPHGHGHTTPNLTSPLEQPCLTSSPDPLGQPGHWHQATNALKLILRPRPRHGERPLEESHASVHFAIMHRKFSNIWDLPLRYERYFVVWDTQPPFAMRAMSRYPVLVWNETASGWSGEENWILEEEEKKRLEEIDDRRPRASIRTDHRPDFNTLSRNASLYPLTNTANVTRAQLAGSEDIWHENNNDNSSVYDGKQENWAYFTYTPSIAWAWRPQSAFAESEDVLESLNVGYLDDEVILGIGMDDTEQAFARAKAETLLQCLRPCPGMRVDEHKHKAGGEEDVQEVIMRFEREDELMRADTENIDFLDVWP